MWTGLALISSFNRGTLCLRELGCVGLLYACRERVPALVALHFDSRIGHTHPTQFREVMSGLELSDERRK